MVEQTDNSKGAGSQNLAPFVSGKETRGAPIHQLHVWPNRSLPKSGFRDIIIFTALMLCIPLIPILGSPVGWALLPFLAGTVLLLWYFIRRNYRDGRLNEEICLWDDLIEVVRTEVNGTQATWQANPYWVTVHIYPDAKLENYLTLKGNGREIEIGAFLSPEERLTLRDELESILRNAAKSR